MIEIKKLGCGVRLCSEKIENARMVSLGIWVGTGSAYEKPEIAGISHFIEHMFFKGTQKRSYEQLARELDDLGVSYNAATGKEATLYYFKSLTDTFPKALEILLDQFTASVFPEEELTKERGVILEEMAMYEDAPDDHIFDVLDELVFAGTDLAAPVIGNRKSLASIGRSDILAYIKSNYAKENIVISVCGEYDEDLLIGMLNSTLGGFAEKAPGRMGGELAAGARYACESKDINQSHIAFAIPGLNLQSKNYYAQLVVSDVLGGGMSSRLFQNVREKRGLCYSVYSSVQAYKDFGQFYIYGGVCLGKEKEFVKAVESELCDMASSGISEEQLAACKCRLKAAAIFGEERIENRMRKNGKNLLILGRCYEEEDIISEIEEISVKDVEGLMQSFGHLADYSSACISKKKINIENLIG